MFLVAATAFAAVPRGSRGPARPQPRERKDLSGAYTIDAITDYANHIRVGAGKTHRNLTLFPILASKVRVPAVDLTLDKAVALDLVDVSELKDPDVNKLRVRSRAKKPVFVMAGEMLRGGQQDRIVGDDLILPPGAELVVSVFCVEHGRWSGRVGGGFTTGHSLAGAGVRGAAGRGGGARGGGQSGVWSKVAEQQEALHAPSATGSLRSVHDSAEVREKMKPYLRAFSDLPDDNPKGSGVVAVVDDEILAADLFSSPALFRQMWSDLLESYVIDALEKAEADDDHRSGEDRERRPNGTRVQHWLDGVKSAARKPKDTPGDGVVYELRGRDVSGAALIWDRGLVHMELFPEFSVKDIDYNSLRFRRDRLRHE
jgi:hypothetical protein